MFRIEYFQYVIEVARAGSINKAAENLYLSQPYLSLCLKELESELNDVKLFKRSNRGVTLTETGEKFLMYAYDIHQIMTDVKRLGVEKQKDKETLNISSMYSFTFLDLYYNFSLKQPETEHSIAYEEIPNRLIPEKVMQGDSDIGLYYMQSNEENKQLQKLEKEGLTYTELRREGLYIVVSPLHPLAQCKSVTLSQIRKYPLVVEKIKSANKEEGQLNLLFPDVFRSFIRHPLTFDNNRSLMYFLTKSDNCFTLGQKCLNLSNPFYTAKKLTYIPISDLPETMTAGYLLSNRKTGRLCNSFRSYIENFFNEYNTTGELNF